MNIKQFINNSYIETIYNSFRKKLTDKEFANQLREGIHKLLDTKKFEVISVEGGMGLSFILQVEDHSRVRAKLSKGEESISHLAACAAIQDYLISKEFPCIKPIGKPITAAGGILQIEEFNDTGEYRDSHQTETMKLQAATLADLHHHLTMYQGDTTSIEEKNLPRNKLWKNPPQAVFDFSSSERGSEYIRNKATQSKAIIDSYPPGKTILSHEDWSNKHFRFSGNGISVIYDWDSIKRIDELYTIGIACSTFTTTWYFPTKLFPSPEEARHFVQTYERYAERQFTEIEMELISAYAAYTLAYIARATHALQGSVQPDSDFGIAIQQIQNGKFF